MVIYVISNSLNFAIYKESIHKALGFYTKPRANMQLPERTDLMQKAPLNSRRRIYIRREGLNGGSKPKI